MPVRTAKKRRGDTVSYRANSGETFNGTVLGEQPTTPTMNAPTTSTSGGTLATGLTCSYRLSVVVNGAESQAAAAQTVVTGAGSTNKCTITWPAVTGANEYRIYGRTSGTELFIASIASGTTTFDDTGSVTPAGTLPVAGEIGILFGGKRGTTKFVSAAKATAAKQKDVYYLR